MFYKAYEKSAFLLCTKVSPLKVSRMTVKNLPEPLVRVGFPITSLEKFSNGMTVNELDGIIVASFPEKPSLDGFREWKNSILAANISPIETAAPSSKFEFFPVCNLSRRLFVELCVTCAKMQRSYRYSLGEDLRRESLTLVSNLVLAVKRPSSRLALVQDAEDRLVRVQVCLKALNEIGTLTDKRYTSYMEMTNDIASQLSARGRSLE